MLTCTAYNPVAATTIVLMPNNGTPVPVTLDNLLHILFKAPSTNAGPLNVQLGTNLIPAVKETSTGQVALEGGEIVTGLWQQALYDAATGNMIIAPFTKFWS